MFSQKKKKKTTAHVPPPSSPPSIVQIDRAVAHARMQFRKSGFAPGIFFLDLNF
jgi:hypothetical protein